MENIPDQVPTPESTVKPVQRISRGSMTLYLLIAFVIGAFAAYFIATKYLKQNVAVVPESEYQYDDTQNLESPNQPTDKGEVTIIDPVHEDPITQSPVGNKIADKAILGTNILEVKWNKQSKLTSSNSDFGFQIYELGVLTNSNLKDAKFSVRVEQGMGISLAYVITKGTQEYDLDSSIRVKGIHITDLPEEIELPGVRGKLKLLDFPIDIAGNPNSKDNYLPAYQHPIAGKLYKFSYTSNCLIVELPSHLLAMYQPITSPTSSNYGEEEFRGGSLSLTKVDGKKFEGKYEVFRATCGSGCVEYPLVEFRSPGADGNPYDNLASKITLFGKTASGEQIYVLKDSNDQILKDAYGTGSFERYDDKGQPVKSNFSYAKFLATEPLLFWQDAYGRWAELKNMLFVPPAEMCKPAIYLYPTTTSLLNVKVTPPSPISISIPEYKDGWIVEATPTGLIRNVVDNKYYPYLFWEASGYTKFESQEGYVVSRSDLDTFFSKTLAEYGLNEREIFDFKIYWIPKLSNYASPYYAINFETDTYAAKVPITVTPQAPDTQIRLLMYARPMSEKVSLREPVKPTKKVREGFVLVEWGGAFLNSLISP